MAIYSINYQKPGDPRPMLYEIGASSEGEARDRFFALSWVAMQPISIQSVALKSGQPKQAKAAAKAAPVKRPKTAKYQQPEPAPKIDDLSVDAQASIRAQAAGLSETPVERKLDQLTEDINRLANRAQQHTRDGEHDLAARKRAEAKKLSDLQLQLLRKGKRK